GVVESIKPRHIIIPKVLNEPSAKVTFLLVTWPSK
ncbi:MAG: hypothetical protein ACI9VT_001557, partial [Psychroserpens sp.]